MKIVSQLTQLNIDGLRSFLRPEFSGIPGEDLEQIVNTSISEIPQSAAEDFVKAIGSFGKAAGPSMAQGAATGASVGGPWGALIGAGAGLASSTLGKNNRPSRSATPAPGVAVPPSATVSPDTTITTTLPTGQGAAATLLGILQNPSVQQALMSQVLGQAGKQQIPAASGASLPRGAINSLLMQLLANATEGLVESESISEQEYLQDDSGEYLVDPASPEQQAAVVLFHLQPGTQFSVPYSGEFAETVEWIAEFYDSESEDWVEYADNSEMVRFY